MANPPRNEAAEYVRPNAKNMGANQATKPSNNEALKARDAEAGFLGKRACPRAYGAKRVRVRIREKEGFKHPSLWRAPCFWGAKNAETAR